MSLTGMEEDGDCYWLDVLFYQPGLARVALNCNPSAQLGLQLCATTSGWCNAF
jgi:hypothetical protein